MATINFEEKRIRGLTVALIFIERQSRSSSIGQLAVDSHHDRGARDRRIAIVHPTGASTDGIDASWKNTTIAVRSNRDRGPIEPRSQRDRAAIVDLSPWNRVHDLQRQ